MEQDSIKFINQREFQGLLAQELSRRKLRNPELSIRAFSKRIDLSSSALSAILRGKRSVSRKIVIRTLERLELEARDRRRAIAAILNGHATDRDASKAVELTEDQFALVSEWYHFAILSLIESSTPIRGAEQIALKLGMSIADAKESLDRLLRLGMVKRDSSGRWRPLKVRFTSSDGVPSAAVRRAHGADLELARRSLDRDPVSRRDFTSMTFCMDPRKMTQAREAIRQFQDQLMQTVRGARPSEVYKISVQLIPLTQEVSADENENE